MVSVDEIRKALEGVMDPEIHRSIVELDMVRDIKVEGKKVEVTIALTVATCPLQDTIAEDVAKAIEALEEGLDVHVILTEMTDEEKKALTEKLQGGKQRKSFPAAQLNKIKTVVAVMSGKGGVGKSTVAALLAAGLRRKGLRVGVLDADITGPSIPLLFGVHEPPAMGAIGIMPPISRGGVKIMSINLMLRDEGQAVIWRGPLITSAIQQFWSDVFWGDLDVLVVDMPPGTSDAALTVMQNLPVSGIILVTSPQDLAEMVVSKAANMAKQMKTPIWGIVENMSYVICPHCGERIDIFGKGKTEALAAKFNTAFLGQLPIDPEISKLGDSGEIEAYLNTAFEPTVEMVAEKASKATTASPFKFRV